ncbi:hypothetical protein EVAR_65424_1 [Eumeta japonica]|uniref:Sushi domain-containing protein n=1 Tax=Eumeta variegata TaxID=151549 RepID=A0A4C1YLP0_EUMVA|nr:hypothetical protein EVAR_65424_1 [Eumeta japonica]
MKSNLCLVKIAPVTQKRCVLPQYPENGSYIVINNTKAGPGDAFDDLSLILYTSDEYFALEVVYVACARGAWSREILKRVPRSTEPCNHLTNQEASPKTNTNPECCKLPPYPEHGLYVVAGDASAKPGDERASASLEYACRGGYGLVGAARVRCDGGTWRGAAPKCLNTTEISGYGSEIDTRLHGVTSTSCRYCVSIIACNSRCKAGNRQGIEYEARCGVQPVRRTGLRIVALLVRITLLWIECLCDK